MSTSRANVVASAWKRVRWELQGALLAGLWLLMRSLSPRRAAMSGAALLRALGPLTRRHGCVLRNLSTAFPTHTPVQRRALARAAWSNFGAVLAEYPHLRSFCDGAAGTTLAVRVAPAAQPLLAAGRPAIFVAAHLANWELAAVALGRLGVPLSVVYAPQGNPRVERLLQAQRAQLGCRFIGKRQALRRVLADLAAGRSVGLLSDQRADAGELLPFFGQAAQTATSPAWLAARTGCPLLPVQVERLGHASYAVTVHGALATPGTGRAAVRGASVALNRVYEAWIRQRPEQWLCMRRRWPQPPQPEASPCVEPAGCS